MKKRCKIKRAFVDYLYKAVWVPYKIECCFLQQVDYYSCKKVCKIPFLEIGKLIFDVSNVSCV